VKRTDVLIRLPLAAFAAALILAVSPQGALAGEGPEGSGQPPPGKSTVVVEEVQNGPVFGVEFKFTGIDGQDAYLLGGYAGALFDDKLLVGGAGYWRVDDYWNRYGDGYHDHYGYYDGYGYHGATGYGGLIVEAYPLRSSAASLSVRGLIGGGVSAIGGNGFYDYGYYGYNQTYFIFEPQVNVSLRLARGVAMVGGVGYRVIGWANGWEDQIGGLTGSFAIRFGGR
jgi:hypothetical protein